MRAPKEKQIVHTLENKRKYQEKVEGNDRVKRHECGEGMAVWVAPDGVGGARRGTTGHGGAGRAVWAGQGGAGGARGWQGQRTRARAKARTVGTKS